MLDSLLHYTYNVYQCSYSVEYAEDAVPVFPLNTTGFSITDEDNVFLLQSTLTVENIGMTTQDKHVST